MPSESILSTVPPAPTRASALDQLRAAAAEVRGAGYENEARDVERVIHVIHLDMFAFSRRPAPAAPQLLHPRDRRA